jgi:hypothetical protein
MGFILPTLVKHAGTAVGLGLGFCFLMVLNYNQTINPIFDRFKSFLRSNLKLSWNDEETERKSKTQKENDNEKLVTMPIHIYFASVTGTSKSMLSFELIVFPSIKIIN